jgi:hypothetical protein
MRFPVLPGMAPKSAARGTKRLTQHVFALVAISRSNQPRNRAMPKNLTSKPFILSMHEDHALALRELRDEETRHVVGGASDDCVETWICTADPTEMECVLDCE